MSKENLGQYFTKPEIAKDLVELVTQETGFTGGRILEPAKGTGAFLVALRERGFSDVSDCEIDPSLKEDPRDFFEMPLEEKFDLIIGNPPFSKLNFPASFFEPQRYHDAIVKPSEYGITSHGKIEHAFLMKSMEHLTDAGIVAFILPISFWIARKHRALKQELSKRFKSIVIFQDERKWFSSNTPCCFCILSNLSADEGIKIIWSNMGCYEIDKDLITCELIPQSYHYKHSVIQEGVPLSQILSEKRVKMDKTFTDNTVSASNILSKSMVIGDPTRHCLAVCRVGNSSVGRAGLLHMENDKINDMFYLFAFNDEYDHDAEFKEKVCAAVNASGDYFQNISVRIGSKSIKRADVMNLRVKL